MQKFIMFLVFSLAIIFTAQAQQPEHRERFEGNERVQAARVAYLTQRLELTADQSAAFWPVFRAYEAERKALRKDIIRKARSEMLSEEEAQQLLTQQLELEEQMLNLKRSYNQKFLEVITARQLIKLPKADRDFRKEMLRMIGNRGDRRRPQKMD